MLAVFPQFLNPRLGPLWMQAGMLGGITALTQTAVYGLLALLASQATRWFERYPGASAITARVIGSLLLATAALTVSQLIATR
jgi:threonine/homoserine/homoserine lactone efflux protein